MLRKRSNKELRESNVQENQIYNDVRAIIKRAREETKFLMRSGFILDFTDLALD
ncbi:MAG: hypothetical protein ABSA92_04515 [Candidatus Bathyarchaeia archaeon]